MLPMEILDAQRDLLERLEGDDWFQKFTAIAADAVVGHLLVPDSQHPLPAFDKLKKGQGWEESVPAGAQYLGALTNYVRGAYAYRVTHDMCLLLEHAAASLDDGDTFDVQGAPTGCGIIHFERPIKVLDARGKTMLIHWAVWGPASAGHGSKNYSDARPALAWMFYNDTWIEPDEVWEDFSNANTGDLDPGWAENIRHHLGRWMSVHQTISVDGLPLGPTHVAPSAMQQARAIVNQDAYGEADTSLHPATNVFRYMHALFLLLNQTVVTTTDEALPRPIRRRAERAGIPPKVTTIALRRHANANRQEGESLVEWSHRWIVRGHWRWQACGPNRSERKRIWIAPYVKGPEDKDLLMTEHVYSLQR